MPIHRFRLHLAKTLKTHKGIARPRIGTRLWMPTLIWATGPLALHKIRNALPVAITPKYNVQFKAVRCSLRLLVITYAFLANEKTEVCS